MHDIYTYVPETTHVYRVNKVAAILYLLFMIHVMLFPVLNVPYFYISTSRSMCAVPYVTDFVVLSFHGFPLLLLLLLLLLLCILVC